MKFVYAFALALAFSVQASADVEIRVPVVFTAYDSNGQSYNLRVSDLTAELKAAGLDIPEVVILDESGDQEELFEISSMVEDAKIIAPGSNPKLELYVQLFGRLSDYETPGKEGVCYLPEAGKTDRQNAEEAYELLTMLGDGVLSDQYSIFNYRFFDEPKFLEDRSEGGFEIDELNSKYASIALPKGAVQVVASTNDSGDDDKSDVLAPCAP
jgi:hypothetical protein